MSTSKYAKSLFALIITVIFYTAISNNIYAQDNNKKYSEKDIPKTVLESFKASYPNAQITGYDVGKENGIKIYEIETKEGNLYRDMEYTADGKLSEIGEIIEISALPESVVSSVNNKYKYGKILEAEKKTRSSVISYEVITDYNGKKYKVLLGQNGKILKQSDEDNENDKESDDDN
ncbi:MAG: hypothetical protein LH629_02800 [Ignavibacteria bacterium]|nr:hypothetical protein [Ignavibacteria bacterium]